MSEPTPGPGADLKAARESLQVSIREVADALNLPARVIEALETDDYERLPPTVFTRGYLRSYARLLELPSDALLARYPEVTEEVEIASDTRTGTHAVVSGSRSLLLPVSIGVIVIVALLVWLLRDDDAPAPASRPSPAVTAPETGPQSPPPESMSPEARSLPEPVIATGTDSEIGGDAAAAAVVEAPQAVEPESPTPEVPATVTPPTDEPAAAAPIVEAREPQTFVTPEAQPVTGVVRERRITEFGDDQMMLRFTEDCWVEVKSLDGAGLYSDLNRAGATLVLTGRAPFRLLLGYAPGVSLEFNGEPVALSRYSRNNVASLVLGQ
ncbi:MAG: RodZ domain-containing protein [Pseudomonadales bacterium]